VTTTQQQQAELRLARVGEAGKRHDAVPKVAGEFEYASDLHAAGMLWGVTVRSPHAHARIVELDISAALRLPGVHAVLTHADVPGQKTYGLEFADQPVLAAEQVRYYGEPVALVAADEIEQARRAAAAVRVEYELLEPVVDMERATEQPPLHPDRPTMAHGYREDDRPNVVRHMVLEHGDPEAEGDVTVTGTYEIGIQDQAFLGPESGLAVPDGEGGVDVYVATQWLHVDRDQVAPCLGLPPDMVRIHLSGVGGAFGGREDLSMQIHGAMLALHTKRPVKIVYNREESFFGHVHRHPARIWCEHRATKAGELVNVRMKILLDGGAYASSSTAVTSNAACFAIGPYKVANALIESTCVYTNNPPCGAMRGFGAVQTCFAAEAQMDKLASALGIDPIELRLLNALASGDTLPTGQVIEGTLPTADVIRRAAELSVPEPEQLPREAIRLPGGAGNTTRGEGVQRGVGFAVGFKNICYSEGFDDFAAARVILHPDGSAEIHCAAAEVGQGVTDVILQVARTELATDAVTLALPGTAAVGSAGSASASRMTWMASGAVRDACRAALEERQRTPGEVDVERIYRHPRTMPLDPDTGQITGGRAHVSFAVAAMRVVAEVDVDLGLTRVVWIGTAQDIGAAINPLAVEGQIEGGTAQGLGLALMEEIRTRDGLITNASFTDYLIPTTLDMPPVQSVLVEDPEPGAPYGVKGVGEPPTVVSTAAVVSALRAATGRELTRVPVRPDDIAL
jgi:CO/xanthine dehydrogenase Mo-binding subunit